MRRTSITPNKKTNRQVNQNKLTHMMNTLFMSSLGEGGCNNNFLTTTSQLHHKHSTSNHNYSNSNKPKLINFQTQISPQAFISKKLSPKSKYTINIRNNTATTTNNLNVNNQTQRSHSLLMRPKTSNMYTSLTNSKQFGSNCSKQYSNNNNSNSNKGGLRLNSALSTARKNKYNTNQQNTNIQDAVKIQYTLGQSESIIQKTGSKPSKSINSTKPLGLIKGYSVNSHRFYINPMHPSQARICIVANLTKVSKKQCIISFYSLFQAFTSNHIYIDYLRQNFSNQISPYLSNIPIPPITVELIEDCLRKIQKKFCQFYKISTTYPSYSSSHSPAKKLHNNRTNLNKDISFAMLFTRNSQITVCLKGSCQINISSNYAAKINKLTANTISTTMRQKLCSASNMGIKIKYFNKQDTNVMDYITLTSSGVTDQTVFSNINSNDNNTISGIMNNNSNNRGSGWLHRYIWLSLMKQISYINQQQLLYSNINNIINNPNNIYKNNNNYNNIHDILGRSMDSIISLFAASMSAKNMSIILLGFNNIQKLYDTNNSTIYTNGINNSNNNLLSSSSNKLEIDQPNNKDNNTINNTINNNNTTSATTPPKNNINNSNSTTNNTPLINQTQQQVIQLPYIYNTNNTNNYNNYNNNNIITNNYTKQQQQQQQQQQYLIINQ